MTQGSDLLDKARQNLGVEPLSADSYEGAMIEAADELDRVASNLAQTIQQGQDPERVDRLLTQIARTKADKYAAFHGLTLKQASDLYTQLYKYLLQRSQPKASAVLHDVTGLTPNELTIHDKLDSMRLMKLLGDPRALAEVIFSIALEHDVVSFGDNRTQGEVNSVYRKEGSTVSTIFEELGKAAFGILEELPKLQNGERAVALQRLLDVCQRAAVGKAMVDRRLTQERLLAFPKRHPYWTATALNTLIDVAVLASPLNPTFKQAYALMKMLAFNAIFVLGQITVYEKKIGINHADRGPATDHATILKKRAETITIIAAKLAKINEVMSKLTKPEDVDMAASEAMRLNKILSAIDNKTEVK